MVGFAGVNDVIYYITNANVSPIIILLNIIMSLDIDFIYANDIFRLQSSDTTFGELLYLA